MTAPRLPKSSTCEQARQTVLLSCFRYKGLLLLEAPRDSRLPDLPSGHAKQRLGARFLVLLLGTPPRFKTPVHP
jgi:hypothetical protein